MCAWKQESLNGFGLQLKVYQESLLPSHWKMAEAQVEKTWKWYTVNVRDKKEFESLLGNLWAEMQNGKSMVWSIYQDSDLENPVGSTSYLNISEKDRRVEIGSTWLYPPFQGTFINTAAKILLLDFAFGVLNCQRLELKTDSLNVMSQKAMEAIGATYEGTFRNHMMTEGGRTRHTVWYAFYAEEWAHKRQFMLARLEEKLKSVVTTSQPLLR
jgi:RimJ/RimL family protein N-acetyltransferase